jgi:protein TonB
VFTTLLESRAARQRRAGGSVASIVIHSVIITAAIAATARHAVVPPPAETVLIIPFIRPQLPPPAASHPVATASMVPAPPNVFQRFVVPTVVPTTVPSIDFSAAPASPDFTAGPIAPSGVECKLADCSGPKLVDGQALLSARDVMMQLRDEPVPPRYPESLRRAGIEGDVMVKFVVDTTGMIDMRQVEILSSAHELFTNAVRESLARMRFSPSMVGERKVRALAVMPFRFRLR